MKDREFLAERDDDLATYALKATEAPAWLRLQRLLKIMAKGADEANHQLRRRRAQELANLLTRASGPQKE